MANLNNQYKFNFDGQNLPDKDKTNQIIRNSLDKRLKIRRIDCL